MKKYALLLALLLIPGLAYGASYEVCDGTVANCAELPPPVITQPANKGDSYYEPDFFTSPVRLTNKPVDNASAGGDYLTYITPIYSTTPLINCDSTRVVLEGANGSQYICLLQSPWTCSRINLRGGTYQTYVLPGFEGQWDAIDPDILYHGMTNGNMTTQPTVQLDPGETTPPYVMAALYKYNASTGSRTVLVDFNAVDSRIQKVYSATKGASDVTSRYFPVRVYGPVSGGYHTPLGLAVYDKATGLTYFKENPITTINSHSLVSSECRSVSMTPNGDALEIITTSTDVGCGGSSGNWVFTLNFKTNWAWDGTCPWANHLDMGYDSEGEQVIVDQGGQILVYTVGNEARRWKIYDHTASGYEPTFHMSYNSDSTKKGWMLLSTASDTDETKGDAWNRFRHMMVEVNPDKCLSKWNGSAYVACSAPPRIWRIANVRSDTASGGNYRVAGWGVLSKNMDKIVWANNWDTGGATLESYYVNLPSTWYNDFAGVIPHRGSAYFNQVSYSTEGINVDYSISVLKKNTDETPGTGTTSSTKRKVVNPNLITLYYDNALTHGGGHSGETPITTYRVVDKNTGAYIKHRTQGWYMYDISNATYRSNLASFIAATLTANPTYNGVMLDDCWYNITTALTDGDLCAVDGDGNCIGSIPAIKDELYVAANFKANMVLLFTAIKTAIGSKLLYINGGIFESTYYNSAYIDGCIDESWSDRANWNTGATGITYSTWLNHLNAVDNVIAAGKKYLAISGVSDGAEAARWNRFAFGSYLLKVSGAGSNAYTFTFVPSSTYSSDYWYDEYDKASLLGSPTAAYTEVSTNVFKRTFANGVVVVNASASSAIVSTDYGTLTVAGYDAQIAYGGAIPTPVKGLIIISENR